jgi:hypothetical protein
MIILRQEILMRDNETYFLPLYERIFSIIIGVFPLYLIYYSVTLDLSDSKYILLIVSIILFLGILFFIEMIFVKYIFKEDEIIVKFPFLKEQICCINKIIGFAFLSIKGESSLNIYTEKNRITIKLEGKKLKQKIIEFINNNYNIVSNKNIKEMEEHGIEYFNKKTEKIIFFKDKIEIYKGDIKVNNYFFNKDIKSIKNSSFQFLTLYTNDNKKISINIYKIKGRFGLFEYIIGKYK